MIMTNYNSDKEKHDAQVDCAFYKVQKLPDGPRNTNTSVMPRPLCRSGSTVVCRTQWVVNTPVLPRPGGKVDKTNYVGVNTVNALFVAAIINLKKLLRLCSVTGIQVTDLSSANTLSNVQCRLPTNTAVFEHLRPRVVAHIRRFLPPESRRDVTWFV